MQSFSKITLQQRKGYREVFVYYSRHGTKFRESTRVKIFDCDVGDMEGTLSAPSNSEAIRTIHRRVEDLIIHYIHQYDERPPVQWLRLEFDKLKIRSQLFPDALSLRIDEGDASSSYQGESESKMTDRDLFAFWDDFIRLKRQTTRSEGTIKRYNNLVATVRKFCDKYNLKGFQLISINSLNQEFFNCFLQYMAKEHEYTHSTTKTDPNAVEFPEVGLSNETILKRISDLLEYLSYCKRRKGAVIDMEEVLEYLRIAKFKYGIVKQCDSKKWELTLTPEELQFTINLDYYQPQFYRSLSLTQRRYLDIFLFMCLQGTSPIDTKQIKPTDIIRNKLIGDRRKTRIGFKVELDPVAEQILKRYDYNLSFTAQAFNEAVKKIFVTIFELYRPLFEDKCDEEYLLIYTQRKSKGDEEFFLVQHKGLYAEAMTGRRTFITNLNEETDERGMRENMRRTGHTRVQTHLGYQKDRQTGKTSRKRSLFGVSKIIQQDSDNEISTARLRRKHRQRKLLDRVTS